MPLVEPVLLCQAGRNVCIIINCKYSKRQSLNSSCFFLCCIVGYNHRHLFDFHSMLKPADRPPHCGFLRLTQLWPTAAWLTALSLILCHMTRTPTHKHTRVYISGSNIRPIHIQNTLFCISISKAVVCHQPGWGLGHGWSVDLTVPA